MIAPNLRRDACPSLAAPMATGDGLLARLNPVAGSLSAGQLLGLAEASARHGNGIVEITQRGSLQIRGLSEASARLLANDVQALDIAVRSGVPIAAGPLAGLDPTEIADPTHLASSVLASVEATGLAARLGPKVSVLVDGGGNYPLDELTADIRVRAVAPNRWHVLAAVDVRHDRLVHEGSEQEAAETVLALLNKIAALGRRGRARDLTVDVPPSAGMELNLGSGLLLPGTLKDYRHTLPMAVAFGATDAPSLARLATHAAETSGVEFRLAPHHRLIAICLDRGAAENLRTVAADLGLIVASNDVRLRVTPCPGSPACGSGHIPARALAAAIAPSLPAGVDVHLSGCAKRCAKPRHLGLTVIGDPDGAALYDDDRSLPLSRVAKGRMEAAIRRAVEVATADRIRASVALGAGAEPHETITAATCAGTHR